MSSSRADGLVPLAVGGICAVALLAVSQLGPDRFGKGPQGAAQGSAHGSAQGSALVPMRAAAGGGRTAGDVAAGALAPKLSRKIGWRAQPGGRETLTRIGFGSCLRQDRAQPIWQAVVAAKPQTFLMMGDNVYGDFKDEAAGKLVAAYETLSAHAEFAKASAAVPMLATWDDHDYGLNDGGADFAHKGVAGGLFRQFWAGSGTLEGTRGPGLAYARAFGPGGRRVQIIMLDTRSFRSALKLKPKGAPGKGRYQPDPSAEKTMLGDAQWQWLEVLLKEPAELRLIVSSVQVIAEGHNFERWGNLPNERERLFKLLDETKAGGVIFLSGDRHRASFYRMNRPGLPPIVEATSSALNSSFRDPEERGPHQLAPMFGENNFGMAVIDWEARVVTLTLRGEKGIAARVIAVPIGALR